MSAQTGKLELVTEPRLLLIDGHSLAFRAFYALPTANFMTSTGQHTNAVHGFTSMLIKLLNTEEPSHLCVAFDMAGPTFRTVEYPDYKGTRQKTPEEFHGQVDLIKEVLDAANITHVGLDGYEADDILATLSVQAAQAGMKVGICSGDRDTVQLINDRVTLLYPIRGVSELEYLDPAAAEEKYLVKPEQYPDLAALVGETSDNLPGVPGVGPKTAAKWLNQYGDLETLLANMDSVKGKVGDSLREHVDSVKRNRKLNHLLTDLELPVELDKLAITTPDREAINTLFDTLQFNMLRGKLFEALPGEGADSPETEELVLDSVEWAAGELGDWFETQEGLIGVDMDGTSSAGAGDIFHLGFASEESAIFVDVASLSVPDEKSLVKWLASDSPKAVHSGKGFLLGAHSRGWTINGIACDTELDAYLLLPDQRNYHLENLSVQFLGRELIETVDDGGQATLDFGEDDPSKTRENSMLRAATIRQLALTLTEKLGESGRRLANEVELPLQRMLAKMEATGICVSEDRLLELQKEFDGNVTAAQNDAYVALGHEVNLASPKQLQVALFDDLGLPKTRKIKSGYTTDADALTTLYARTEHPFLEALLRHRDQIKLRQTVDGLLKTIQPDGRIHTTFMQIVAATGRLSSVDPNLQNIPFRTESGRRIRNVFVPGDGFESLMSADYSQIEMRVMAHVSGDEQLIEAFKSGRDFHSEMAARVFGAAPDQVTPAQRSKVKAMNYGLAYGLSAYGLSNQLKIEVAEARTLMNDYFAKFGAVQDYLQSVVEQARKSGYTETILGRRRYLPDLNSSNRQRREMAERAALNAPIQGSAADIMKIAMLKVDRALAEAGLRSRVLLQVHDELILEIAPGEEGAVSTIVVEEMANAADLKVPLEVSVGVGESWQDAQHS